MLNDACNITQYCEDPVYLTMGLSSQLQMGITKLLLLLLSDVQFILMGTDAQ